MRKKRSFFQKLTGSINAEEDAFMDGDFEYMHDDEEPVPIHQGIPNSDQQHAASQSPYNAQPEEEDAELTVDVYQTPTDIIVQTIVAGVSPGELDVSITREMVSVSGRRERHMHGDGDYVHQELFWGSFSRNILLPEEIEVEEAEASEKHGLLTIKLPKIDKKKKTKLQIQAG